VIRRLALLAALVLLGAAPALAAPAGTTFATTTVVVDGITTGTVKLTTLSVLGFPSYATRARVKLGAFFDLVPNTGSPADNINIVDAPDGRQWTIVGGAGGVSNPVPNSQLANMANGTTKCRTTAGTGAPEDCTAAQERAVLGLSTVATTGAFSDTTGTVAIARGGTGQTTATAAYDALTVQGADVASAGTTDLCAATGSYVRVTGTTTITALGTCAAGIRRSVKFTGVLTITHNATSLILPGGSNITTTANDVHHFVSLGSGNWQCIDQPATGGGGSGITQLTGDVTAGPGSGAQGATVINLPAGVTQAGRIVATAIAAPATPSAGTGAVYVDSTSKNLAVKDDAGNVNHGVRTNTGSANQWVSAIADNGAATTTQPALTNLAAGTSADLRGVLSDETGTGAAVFATSPTIATPTISGNMTMSAGNIDMGSAADIYHLRNVEYTSESNGGNKTGAAQALADFAANGSLAKITLTGNVSSSTWSMPTAGPTFVQLKVCQDATGGRTLVWPTSPTLNWLDGSAPTLTTTASACELYQFYSDQGVSTVWGWPVKGGVSTVTASAPISSSGGTAPNITLGTVGIGNGGTGQTTAGPAYDALSVQQGSIASAGTTSIASSGGVDVHITGTTTITSFGNCTAGVHRIVHFDGALTLTHNATSLILLIASNRTTAAGDTAMFTCDSTNNWREAFYSYVAADPLNTFDAGNTGTAITIDWTKHRLQKVTLTGNVTFTFTAPTRGTNVVLEMVEDGTGGRTITLPASVKWTGGTTPTWVTTASAVNVIACYTNTTNYYCSAYTQ